jgi:hypothetical protein
MIGTMAAIGTMVVGVLHIATERKKIAALARKQLFQMEQLRSAPARTARTIRGHRAAASI